jgi:hypothetical protein
MVDAGLLEAPTAHVEKAFEGLETMLMKKGEKRKIRKLQRGIRDYFNESTQRRQQ